MTRRRAPPANSVARLRLYWQDLLATRWAEWFLPGGLFTRTATHKCVFSASTFNGIQSTAQEGDNTLKLFLFSFSLSLLPPRLSGLLST